MSQPIIFRGTRGELIEKLRQAPSILAGKQTDPTGLVQGLQLRLGTTLLGKIQDDFVTMSRGSRGEMGIQWPPLSPVTLALRRKATGSKIVQRLGKEFQRLSPAEKQRVRQARKQLESIFLGRPSTERLRARGLLELRKRVLSQSAYRAARMALEGKLPRKRAKQLAFVGAFAQILRDTGRLFNSLSPGVASTDRKVQSGPGFVTVGTNVSYSKYHQSSGRRKLKEDGTPRLPRRQFLPDEGHPIPKSWWRDMLAAYGRGIAGREFWIRLLGPNAS